MYHLTLLISYLTVVVASAIKPWLLRVWPMEMAPVLIAVVILIWTYKRFTFTDLTYIMLWLGGISVAVGAHFTYAQMPLFDWIRDALHLARNDYDRFGHLVKGISVALLIRELLVRTSGIRYGFWLPTATTGLTLGIAAIYELVEFAGAKLLGHSADEFLGLQGDIWDTQWDMLCSLIGAAIALLLFSRLQDRQINKQTDWNTPASRK